MKNKIKKQLEELQNAYETWESDVLNSMRGELQGEVVPESVKSYIAILDDIYKGIIRGSIKETEVKDLFSDELWTETKKLLDNRLRSYHAFEPIRNSTADQKFQVEQLIDSIWALYVIRFDPENDVKNVLNMTAEQAEELMMAIDAISMYCVSKLYNYNGIVNEVRERTGLSDEWATYLARKIDRDFNELRLNFIVNNIAKIVTG